MLRSFLWQLATTSNLLRISCAVGRPHEDATMSKQYLEECLERAVHRSD